MTSSLLVTSYFISPPLDNFATTLPTKFNSTIQTTAQVNKHFTNYDAISTTLKIEKNKISPDTFLKDLLPRQSRRSKTKKLEENLGFKLDIIRPPHWVTWTLAIILLTSIVGLFFNWQIGLSGLSFSIVGLWFAYKIGNELDLQTVEQLVKKMTTENYLKSRRNPKTFNKSEIEKVLTDWFSNDLDLDKSKLTREAKFA